MPLATWRWRVTTGEKDETGFSERGDAEERTYAVMNFFKRGFKAAKSALFGVRL